jgi:putative ABC transport system ATP-binding protein
MLLEGRELCLVYDLDKEDGAYALKNVDFSLEKGEMVGISGPSGSGKSSLLYLLSGLKKPMSGTVYYRDMDLQDLSQQAAAALRKKEFGFIFQKHFLIEYLSVLDNILIASGRNKSDHAYAECLLERLSISNISNKKPYQLSGGQRQRAAVARALINKPSVIFADEPTVSLDHRNAREVMNVLSEFRETTAILLVSHDATILESADRIVELWDGRVKSVI